MKLLEIIKDSLIENYKESENVNNSLIKEIAQGNIEVIRSGIPDKNSTYMDYGSYIDKVVTEDEEPEVYSYPHTELSGHSKVLVDHLLEVNSPKISIEERLEIANYLKLWANTKKEEKRLELVNNDKINIILNREIAREEGKDVISESDLELAKHILNVLYTHEYSKDIVSPPLKIESFNQLALKFKFSGVECKVLLDFLQVNQKDKTLQPIDLKTGSKKNFLDNYFKYYYWIQGSLYYLAIMSLKNKYKELKDYTILPFKFLYISRENPNIPLVYELDEKSISMYIEGYFDYRNQWKKGIIDYLKDYKFHKETEIYDRTREEYENKGILKLPKPY